MQSAHLTNFGHVSPCLTKLLSHPHVTILHLLAGKRWLHTGVVRLPMAQPQLIAAVLQAALALQQSSSSSSSSSSLSTAELQRNSFRPAAVVATAAAAAAAAAEGGDMGSNSAATAPAAAPTTAGSALAEGDSSGSGSISETLQNVWTLLLRTAAEEQQPLLSASSTSAAPAAGSSSANSSAAAAGLGALGVLLGHRGALGSIPTSTLQYLPKQQQKQQGQPVWNALLDVAGLPVPEHSCCLLPGE
jgi:hypothetical protein